MTDLNIIEKSPGYRINHPNLGDVMKTTYAKGVITDFQYTHVEPEEGYVYDGVASQGPFKVSSLVKVTGNWGESDFIPLFYRPKLGLWDGIDADGDPVGSQDFDTAQKCYKQAWMSFRIGDEVKIMFSEGVPKAIVGFFDGIPRIGEDVLKAVSNGTSYWNRLSQKISLNYDTGPDGTNLGLTEQLEPVYTKTVENISDTTAFSKSWKNCVYPPGHDTGGGQLLVTSVVHHYVKQTTNYYYYIFSAGPLLYLIILASGITESSITTGNVYNEDDAERQEILTYTDELNGVTPTFVWYPEYEPPWSGFGTPGDIGTTNAWIVIADGFSVGPETSTDSDSAGFTIFQGIYKEEFITEVMAVITTDSLASLLADGSLVYCQSSSDWSISDLSWPTSFYIRPHNPS